MSTKKNNIAAGIDIGSNSIRLIIAEVENNKIKNIYSIRDTVLQKKQLQDLLQILIKLEYYKKNHLINL